MQAAYEDEEIITDIVKNDWKGFKLCSVLRTEDRSAHGQTLSTIKAEQRRKQLEIIFGLQDPTVANKVAKKKAAV